MDTAKIPDPDATKPDGTGGGGVEVEEDNKWTRSCGSGVVGCSSSSSILELAPGTLS